MPDPEEKDGLDVPESPGDVGTDSLPPGGDAVPEEGRLRRLRNLARRVLDRRELAEDTRELLMAVLDTSDRAKTEIVRMTAREVRNYLDALRLKEDLLDLATSHSLEISLRLKPLPDVEPRVGRFAPDDETHEDPVEDDPSDEKEEA